MQLVEAGVGVDHGEVLCRRAGRRGVEQDAADLGAGETELPLQRTGHIGGIQHDAASGPAADRGHQHHARRGVCEFDARRLARGRDGRRAGDLFHRFRQPLADLVQMVHQRQAAQRTQALRLQRAGDVVEPATAEPLEELLRVAAIVLRSPQGKRQRLLRLEHPGGVSLSRLAEGRAVRVQEQHADRRDRVQMAESLVQAAAHTAQRGGRQAADTDQQGGTQPPFGRTARHSRQVHDDRFSTDDRLRRRLGARVNQRLGRRGTELLGGEIAVLQLREQGRPVRAFFLAAPRAARRWRRHDGALGLAGRDQRVDHGPARRKPLRGRFRQRTMDHRLICLGQARQARLAVQVLGGQLGRRLARERQRAGEHFLIDDRQAVLVAEMAGFAVEHLRRGVDRGQAAHQRDRVVVDVFDQPEVADLHPAADQQQVLRLHVQVLEREVGVHVVQGVGRVAQVHEQLVPRHAEHLRLAALGVAIFQAAVGQLGDDHELAVDHLDPLQRQQERVADLFDALERFQFARGPHLVQLAVDELDGLDQPAGRVGLPDLAIAAGADAFLELVSGDGLFLEQRHGHGGASG